MSLVNLSRFHKKRLGVCQVLSVNPLVLLMRILIADIYFSTLYKENFPAS